MRDSPVMEGARGHRAVPRLGDGVAAGLGVAWLVGLGLMLRHRLFVSHDTMINYAHVWFVSDRLWHGHGVPLRMPILGHGQAFAFPYGVVPWLTAAILRPALGDWVVTLWLVLGVAGMVVATFFAFPELRRSWWAATLLINPALVSAALIGQLPFTWGAALLLAAVACWRRGRTGWAAVLAGLAQVTHPAVIVPLTLGLVAIWLRFEPDRPRLLRCYAVSLLPALPAAWLVFRSPVFQDSSTWVKAANFVTTLAPRALVLVLPAVLLGLRHRVRAARVGPVAFAAVAFLLAASWQPLRLPAAWQALRRQPDTAMLAFVRSPEFEPGATYRVLRVPDFKVGMYQLLRAGGQLDSEFFPESIVRRSWSSPVEYSAFLRRRNVDYVMVWGGYDRAFHINEVQRLEDLAGRPPEACEGPLVCLRRVEANPRFALYAVMREPST